MKKTFSILLKVLGIALAIWLIVYTVRSSDGDLTAALANCNKQLVFLAVLCYGACNYIAAWRWKMLLDVQNINISVYSAFKLTLIGVFFSQIIPGCVSGDIVKLAFVAKQNKNKTAETLLTIAIDRFLGLYGLVAVGALSCLICAFKYPQLLQENNIIQLAFAIVFCAAIAMPVGWFAILFRKKLLSIGIIDKMCTFFAAHTPQKLLDIIYKLSDATDLYKTETPTVLRVFLMSCVIHTIMALEIYFLGKALHEHVMSFVEYLATAQIGNATGLIPITPGGMGIRDAVSSALLNIFGASPVEVMPLIPVMNTLILVFWALIGAIYFILPQNTQNTQKNI